MQGLMGSQTLIFLLLLFISNLCMILFFIKKKKTYQFLTIEKAS